MREPVRAIVPAMEPPSLAARADAMRHGGSQDANDRFQADWACLNTIEQRQPGVALPLPEGLSVAAWNMERCKRVEDSAALLRGAGADVVLLTEMDWGMARSGQRHTTRDLAGLLGFGHVFGVEFVELGTGDDHETSLFSGVPNVHGLHGNAILSRYPLEDAALVPIDEGGAWYVGQPKGAGQFRVGGRMAIAARIGPLVLVSVHFESESDAQGRAAQAERLLARVDSLFGPGPAVVGGDLNTRGLSDAGMDRASILRHPETAEPAFRHLKAHGFDWRTTNTGAPTTRAQPGRPVDYPLKVLDWIFVRGACGSEPRVIAAVSKSGHYLSDHECILARIHAGETP